MSESIIKRKIRALTVSSAALWFAWTILATLTVGHIVDVHAVTSADAPTRAMEYTAVQSLEKRLERIESTSRLDAGAPGALE